MNWLYVNTKDDPKVKLMLNMDSILAMHFEYHEDKLDKIIIFMPGEIYKIDSTFDHDSIHRQLGV